MINNVYYYFVLKSSQLHTLAATTSRVLLAATSVTSEDSEVAAISLEVKNSVVVLAISAPY